MREVIHTDIGGNTLAIGDYVAYVFPGNSTMRYGRISRSAALTVTVKVLEKDVKRGKKQRRNIARDPKTQVVRLNEKYVAQLMLSGELAAIAL